MKGQQYINAVTKFVNDVLDLNERESTTIMTDFLVKILNLPAEGMSQMEADTLRLTVVGSILMSTPETKYAVNQMSQVIALENHKRQVPVAQRN